MVHAKMTRWWTRAAQQLSMRSWKRSAALLAALLAIAGCAPVGAPRRPKGLPQPQPTAPRPAIPPVAQGAVVVGVASVIDGDTIEIHGQRIRLHGIDAPEASQLCDLDGKPWRCGQASANALAEYLARRTVTCDPRDRDRYRRLVAAYVSGGRSYGNTVIDPVLRSAEMRRIGPFPSPFAKKGLHVAQRGLTAATKRADSAAGKDLRNVRRSWGERLYLL
jgi:endonuclease YncB( thermonuclease family)